MTVTSQEQLVYRIKYLENKIKKYALVLKKRNYEVQQLKSEIIRLNDGDVDFDSILALPKQHKNSESDQTQDSNGNSVETKIPVTQYNGKSNDSDQCSEDTEQQENESFSQEDEEVTVPSVNFKVGEFLQQVLEGEEDADEMKAQLERLENCDKNDRRNVQLSITKLHWRMIDKMGKRLIDEDLPWEKRLFMRFGMLDDQFMVDRKDVWNKLYSDKSEPEDSGIYYIDEWFEAIARQDVNYSTIDEMALDGKKPDPNAPPELALNYELLTIPQMQRMCVGARANTITIMLQEYCSPSRDNPVITRQWLSKTMDEMVKYDYLMFHRKYKGEEFDVQPLFIITPGYGQKSGCWEPWSPGQKGNSGPRICLCAFPPKSSKRALLHGLADYRWEYAKADAMHYWLSEGLTGKWLAIFNKKEQRKDLKSVFIESYFHWIINESHRRPKLEKRFRDYFWHNIPYSDEIKETLKGGGMFGRLIELEEAKKKREEEERQELERIKAEREERKAARLAKMEGN